ncbi:Poly [ADP-ribose] polymerase 2 [Fulvia fulva]|nr:Poly [ADP-ribose] polymerase 2 [Fulvia fulva]KAK4638121.1 Poly [ADP-ribose] polymerase 2 [Fulvia fulva]WPV24799.1 Poly [ADP-ribose] polymerase 2 [Fulvia fulva]
MPALRDRKRAASPVADPDPPRKTRGRQKVAEVDLISSDVEVVETKPAPKRRGRAAAAKGADLDVLPALDSDVDVAPAQTKKAPPKRKTKATKDEIIADDSDAPVTFNDKVNGKDTAGQAQYAKAEKLIIPVDEACPHSGRVFVDSKSGIIYDAALNQTNASGNNNKFYKIQLLTGDQGTFRTWTRWGRVGATGQSALLGNGSFHDALSNFEKKFKDKSGLNWNDRNSAPKSGKYVFLERNYEPESDVDREDTPNDDKQQGNGSRSRSASPAKCTLQTPVKSLMELIFNADYIAETMADMSYDAQKLPLGNLSRSTILRGYQALKDLSALFNDPNLAHSEHGTPYNEAVEMLSNCYYSYIPHDVGRNRPPVIRETERLRKEVTLLESLTDMKDTDSILKSEKGSGGVHPLDLRFKGLGMREMTPVDSTTAEFTNIADYLINTRGHTHGHTYKVEDIFRIERDGETERCQNYAQSNSDRRLLWHGSRATNYGGILSQGLRIAPPEAPVSGYMFGKGVYLAGKSTHPIEELDADHVADMSSKSANYCCSYLSGNHALLLLCEAELGKPMQELTDASYEAGETAAEINALSTWGKGLVGPEGWKDAACVHPSLAGVSMPDTRILPGNTNVPDAYLQYNEYICYDVAQIRLRYLLRVKM